MIALVLARGFMKYSLAFLFFAVFGIIATGVAALLFVTPWLAREVRHHKIMREDWSKPVWDR